MENDMKSKILHQQNGLSILGFVFLLGIVGSIVVVALKVVPTYTEFLSVKQAIISAKSNGTAVREIQVAFDKQANAGYIESISGKDLEIVKNGNDIEVSFAYQKKIPLVGPASLLLEYEGTTAKAQTKTNKPIE